MAVKCESCGMTRESWVSEVIGTLEWDAENGAQAVDWACCEDVVIADSPEARRLHEAVSEELERRHFEAELDELDCSWCGYTWRHCRCGCD